MFVIAAAAVSAMAIVNTLSAIQTAHAAPQSPHGICFFHKGASGCAGNVGGFVETRKDCHQINKGPFNTYSCP